MARMLNATHMKDKSLLTAIIASLIVSPPVFGASQKVSTQKPRTQQEKPVALPDGVSAKNVRFYSEGVQCYGRLFTPKGFGSESKSPAVVLAPGWGETAVTIEKYAIHFASRGLVAMVMDYRGWGKSGGFLQTVDAVKTDDRLRFSEMTARVRIRRKRLIPQHQVLDIRNALYFVQGEPGVDRARIGVWGTGMSGGHAIVIAATDARIKAAVVQTPIMEGKDVPRRASAPSAALLQAEQRRARTGDLPISASDAETMLALNEYHPFWYVEQIPKTAAVLFVIADNDPRAKNELAVAASKLLKSATDVVNVPSVAGRQIDKGFAVAADAAANWFLKHL